MFRGVLRKQLVVKALIVTRYCCLSYVMYADITYIDKQHVVIKLC